VAVATVSVTATQAVLTMPAHAAGAVSIEANGIGGSVLLPGGYKYDDPPAFVSAPMIDTLLPLAGRPVTVSALATDPKASRSRSPTIGAMARAPTPPARTPTRQPARTS